MREAAESYRLPARYMAQLIDYLESTGVDRGIVLRAARIRSLEDPKAQLTLRQVEALLRAAEQVSGRVDLGFELGRRLDPTSHDILGFALLTSPKFGHVLRLLVNYQRLIQPAFALSMQRRAGRVDLVYLPAVALPHRLVRVLQEAIVVSNHFAFQSMLHGELPPYDIWLSIERPPHAERYHELSRARVHFGDAVPGVRISLDAALLDTPLAMANARAMQAAEERCKTMLRQTRARRHWSEWCRMLLSESEDTRTTRCSELLVVLGEDIAATIGLCLALFAVGAAMLTGNSFYDALGSLTIGALLLVFAVAVGIEVKALLVGQSAEPVFQEEIRRFLVAREEIADVLNLITLQNGTEVVVAVKARMTENVSARAMVQAINGCERELRAAFPQVRWLFFEPDLQ